MQPTHRLPPLSLEGRSEARRDLFFFSARTSTITIADPRKPRALGRSKNPNYLPPTSTSAQTIIISLKVTHTQEQHKVTNTHTRERQIDSWAPSSTVSAPAQQGHARAALLTPPTHTDGRPATRHGREVASSGGRHRNGRPAGSHHQRGLCQPAEPLSTPSATCSSSPAASPRERDDGEKSPDGRTATPIA